MVQSGDDGFSDMEKDYKDMTYNTYTEGPGANLDDSHQPAALAMCNDYEPKDKACRIIIHNTGLLTEKGLRRLCSRFGTIIKVHIPKNLNNIMFVEYSNQTEAGHAIEKLNNIHSFDFRAALARNRENNIVQASKNIVLADDDNDYATDKSNPNSNAPTVNRKYIGPFIPPITLTFPKIKPLMEERDYMNTDLMKVDQNMIFSCPDIVPFPRGGFIVNTTESKHQIESMKNPPAKSVSAEGKKNIFTFKSLSEDEASIFFHGRCFLCKNLANYKCSKCQIYYCSKQCQKDDWAYHSKICGNTNDEFEEIKRTKNVLEMARFPAKNSTVIITSVVKQNKVYIRSLEEWHNREYLKTVDDIARYAILSKSISKTPNPGDILLAKYEENGFYRVLIIKSNEEEAVAAYIDIGAVTKIKLKEMRELEDDFLKFRPVFIFKIFIKEVTDELGNIEKAMEYLNSLIETKLDLKFQSTNDKEYELKHQLKGELISKRLNELIEIKVPSIDATMIHYDDIPRKELMNKEKTKIIILDRNTLGLNGFVSCIECKDLEYLKKLEEKIENYCCKVKDFTVDFVPRIRELCLVNLRYKWYRGVCLETVGDGSPTLLLCDYGNLVTAHYKNIRKIPADLATEVRTTSGVIYGIWNKVNNGLKLTSEFVDEYFPENQILEVEVIYEKDKFDEDRPTCMIKVPKFMDHDVKEQ